MEVAPYFLFLFIHLNFFMEILSSIGHFLLVALTFLLIFSVLIILHELGHFWMARLGGVKVEEFGFGLPPKVWAKTTTHTAKVPTKNGKTKTVSEKMLWSINAIPFGGFVRMLGEDSTEASDDPRAFSNRPLLWRMAIVLAGVTMNFLLAFVLFFLVGLIGFEPIIDPNLEASPRFESYFTEGKTDRLVDKGFYLKETDGAFIGAIEPGSPADLAGLTAGDEIVAINDVAVQSPAEVSEAQNSVSENQEITYDIVQFDRETKARTETEITLTPRRVEEQNQIGVILLNQFYYPLEKVRLSVGESAAEALDTSWGLIGLSVDMVKNLGASTLGKLFSFEAPELPSDIGGPVAIATTTNELVEIGDVSKIIQFAAVLSLSLAVLNLVPFPALDGGRFFFQLLEALFFLILWPIKKLFPQVNVSHRIPAKLETPFHLVGYALLLLLIVAVTFQDIWRLIS